MRYSRGEWRGLENKDLIERQATIEALGERPMVLADSDYEIAQRNQYDMDKLAIETVPSAQPLVIHCTDCEDWHERQSILGFAISELPTTHAEPLSDTYMKAVWTWLLDYQIKTAELKGRYAPYEVLSWVANDWRKEHERFNKQTGGL